jgi:hypothetical protein
VTLNSDGAAASATVATPGPTYPIVPSGAVGNGVNNYAITYANGTLTISSATLIVTADNKSRQYSDANPTFTASYSGFVNGETFTTSGVTGAPFLTTSAITTSPVGSYTITAALGTLVSSNYSFNFTSGTLTVTPEDARVTYTGAMFVSTSSATSSNATITLSATIRDITAVLGDNAHDTFEGDIRKATVTFINRDTKAEIATVPVGLVNLSDIKVGTATFNWPVTINGDAQQFTIGIRVNNFYFRNEANDNEVVTVAKPLNDFITGGGFVTLTNPAGLIQPKKGTKNNFGFNVKYNKSGTSLQGNINTIIRAEDGKIYQVKGNVMTSLSVRMNTTNTGQAVFNGKASIQDITNPLSPISIEGNATLQVNMTDAGEPGTSDRIAITVWNKEGGMWFSSEWTGVRTAEVLLTRGNIVVRGSNVGTMPSNTARTSAEEEVAAAQDKSLEMVKASAYPNPFYDKFTVSFGKEITEEVVIQVVDMKGAVVFTKKIAANSYASDVEIDMSVYRPGTYLVQTIIGTNRQVTKMIKQ